MNSTPQGGHQARENDRHRGPTPQAPHIAPQLRNSINLKNPPKRINNATSP